MVKVYEGVSLFCCYWAVQLHGEGNSQTSTVMLTSSIALSFHPDFTHLLYDTEQITSSSCVSISSSYLLSFLLCTSTHATVQNLHILNSTLK